MTTPFFLLTHPSAASYDGNIPSLFEVIAIMRVYVSGNSPRDAYLKCLLEREGHETPASGPWDAVFLSLPRSVLHPGEAAQLRKGQKIVCGNIESGLEKLIIENEWKTYRILNDERFARENAELTAEGALYYAARQSDSALKNSRCLVIGYGRIGRALTERLRALGACVTVAARREESRREAGENSVGTDEIKGVLPEMDFVFSTAPAPLLMEDGLRAARKSALLMELASPPYGIDLAAARALGLRVSLESGVPGRYCPRSAAQLILDYAKREGVFDA